MGKWACVGALLGGDAGDQTRSFLPRTSVWLALAGDLDSLDPMSNVEAPARRFHLWTLVQGLWLPNLQQLVPPLAELYLVSTHHTRASLLHFCREQPDLGDIERNPTLPVYPTAQSAFSPIKLTVIPTPYLSSSETLSLSCNPAATYNELTVKTALCPASVLGLRSALSRLDLFRHPSVEGKRDPLLLFRNPRHPHWHFPPSSQSAPDSAFGQKETKTHSQGLCDQPNTAPTSLNTESWSQAAWSDLLTAAHRALCAFATGLRRSTTSRYQSSPLFLPPALSVSPRKAPKLRRPPI